MKPVSIRLRLSLLVSLLTLTIILVVSVVAYVELEESLLGNVDEILRAMGEGIVATLDEHEDADSREAEFQSIIGNGHSGDSAWCQIWMDGNEKDLFSSGLSNHPRRELLLERLPEEQPDVGETSFFNVVGENERDKKHSYRAIWIRRVQEGEAVNVLVGRSSHYVSHELTEFYQLLLIVGASLTLLAFLLTPVLISWGLRPIAQAGTQLQTITHKSLKQERGGAATVPELKPFMAALDDMLARLDEAMRQQEQFIADAAHELRTPVAVAKSTLQTTKLQRRTVAEYEESIDETLQDVGRLEQLIEQLLSLARLETPEKLRTSVDVRLDAVLGEMAGVFDVRMAQQNGRVIFSEAASTWVRGDENELKQLFSNLLDNVLRHGPRGGTVRVKLEDEADNRVTVSIRDEGGQIPPDAVAHLFDRFYRVDSSRSQASGGSGLGLAIAREIARRHGGDIEIVSDLQTGTTASVHLPRR
jgi:two-component system, OmpR family, heavy metal sensor histidine kinase CusS